LVANGFGNQHNYLHVREYKPHKVTWKHTIVGRI